MRNNLSFPQGTLIAYTFWISRPELARILRTRIVKNVPISLVGRQEKMSDCTDGCLFLFNCHQHLNN